MTQFSVITSVYQNAETLFVRVALDSMLVYQTLKTSEIMMVREGQVGN